jgi:Aerotolerance regulator N-terminal
MPVFTFPLALLGLLAAPALIFIYWLRSQSREHKVSSLLLWLDQKEMWEGGRTIHRLQTPLLFFLELLTILLLVTAAAGPMIRAGAGGRPLVIVLDDSYSMLGGRSESARNLAPQAIVKELRANRYEPVRLILAGKSPQVLGEVSTSEGAGTDQMVNLLKDWKCATPLAKLEEAISFAFELGGTRTRVLVITDHAPAESPGDSRLQWWAFGSPRPNMAFVNATRTTGDLEDRVMLEIANLYGAADSTTLTIEADSKSSSKTQDTLTLGTYETRRLFLTVKHGSPPLRARLRGDMLSIDDQVILVPGEHKTVRVDLRIGNQVVRQLVEKALQSTLNAITTKTDPELVITDEMESRDEVSPVWTLRIISENEAGSYLGPFVVDRAHRMSEGLSLGGVVWGSGKSSAFPGSPIITAGNIPLLTDVERAGVHELRLRLRPDLSTLQETPNWPILISNLVSWRARTTPGLAQANVRLGSDVTLTVESSIDSVEITEPQSNSRKLPVRDGALTVKAELIGVYNLRADENRYSFAVNALDRLESDLTKATSGRWGNWAKAADLQWEYRNMSWVPLLLAMIVLAIHGWLSSRNK